MIKCMCAYCKKLNENIEAPRKGMYIPFFAQDEEETKFNPGAYNIKYRCEFCRKTFCIVWDSDPREKDEKIDPSKKTEKKKLGWFHKIYGSIFKQSDENKEINKLIKDLKEKKYKNDREEATNALVKIGEPSVKALIQVLGSKDHLAREEAANALGKIGDNRALKPLLAALKDKDSWEVRRKAAESLRNVIDKKSTGLLIKALKDKDPFVRSAVSGVLIDVANKGDLKALLKAFNDNETETSVKSNINECFIKIGEPAVIPLISKLKDDNSFIRSLAAKALGKIDDKRAVESLINILNDEAEWARKEAAESLGHIGDERAIKPLRLLLNDVSKSISGPANTAREALEKFGEGALEVLIEALKDEEREVRLNAVKALGKIKNKKAVDPLCKVLTDKDKFVRKYAAIALGEIGDREAVLSLCNNLKDTEFEVRRSITQALGRINDDESVKSLIFALSDRDKDVRKIAAEGLGNIVSPKGAEPLCKALEDENWEVSATSGKALEKIGKPAVGDLIKVLNNKNAKVKKSAIEILGKIMDKDSVEPICRTLTDEDLYVRWHSAIALGNIGNERAVGPLTSALEDKNPTLQKYIKEALKNIEKAKII